MKTLTTLLLTIFTLSCVAQEPRLTYTKEYHYHVVDSIINHYEAIPTLPENDTIDIWKDDFYFRIRDGRLDIEIKKVGFNVWYTLSDTETNKRINADLFNFNRKILLMNDEATAGSLYIP